MRTRWWWCLGIALAVWLGCPADDDDAGDDDGGDDDGGDDDGADDDGGDDDGGDDDTGDDDGGDDDSGDDDGGDDDTAPDPCDDAAALHVATTGTNSGNCGAVGDPCQTIKHALGLVTGGGAVCVHAGTYAENWIEVPDGTWLYSADGPQQAVIDSGVYSAVRFTDISGAGIDGFEVHGDWAQGDPGDGLVRVYDASQITIRDCVIHDAPNDQDCIKVSGQVSELLIEGVVAWNPGPRTGGDCDPPPCYQEVIDIFGSGAQTGDPPPVSDVTVRGCWLLHQGDVGDWLIYSKINVENILYENNVFGPSAGMGWGNAAVGIGTGEAGIPDPTASVATHAIVRNNVFVGCKGDAAFAVMNAEDTWIYGNTFWNNSGADLRSVIMFRGNSHDLGPVYLYDNVFADNDPQQNGATFFWVRDPLPPGWEHDHNLYWDNLATSDTPYTGEANSIYGQDPGLASPAIPDTSNPSPAQIPGILADFGISGGACVDAGLDVVAMGSHPNWHPGITDTRWDIEGDPRPASDAWDLGADELP